MTDEPQPTPTDDPHSDAVDMLKRIADVPPGNEVMLPDFVLKSIMAIPKNHVIFSTTPKDHVLAEYENVVAAWQKRDALTQEQIDLLNEYEPTDRQEMLKEEGE